MLIVLFPPLFAFPLALWSSVLELIEIIFPSNIRRIDCNNLLIISIKAICCFRILDLESIVKETFGNETTWSSNSIIGEIWFDFAFGTCYTIKGFKLCPWEFLVFMKVFNRWNWEALATIGFIQWWKLCTSHLFKASRYNISPIILEESINFVMKIKFLVSG